MRTTTKFASLLLVTLSLVIAGCSKSDRPALGQVSGTVKIMGKPVEHLIILLQPTKGKPGVGETDAEGKYKIYFGSKDVPGAPVGTLKVTFQWPTGHEVPEGVAIPPGWGGDSTTTVDVKAGQNNFDFDLM